MQFNLRKTTVNIIDMLPAFIIFAGVYNESIATVSFGLGFRLFMIFWFIGHSYSSLRNRIVAAWSLLMLRGFWILADVSMHLLVIVACITTMYYVPTMYHEAQILIFFEIGAYLVIWIDAWKIVHGDLDNEWKKVLKEVRG